MASVQRVSTIDDDSLVRETALNGDYPETTATIDLSDSSSITRMEDMLRVATDLQDNSSPHDTNRGPHYSSYPEARSSSSSLMGEGKGTAVVQNNAAAKMDNFKKWSISTSDHQYYAQITPTSSAATFKAEEAKKEFEKQKAKYDRIRNDLTVKLKFLEENKVKVMQRQLCYFITRQRPTSLETNKL
ncbi:arfaptin-2-like isoform X1 [Paramuricea clavata]|uniref:Arfaptin-2-like isoform X1 n=1 Tax=Paramuricea clavata TaxID=317549 RepID=A0A6S7FV49_PARCT|nr:arfaptin-2-like isoform X1 [Paramuricea clavata]